MNHQQDHEPDIMGDEIKAKYNAFRLKYEELREHASKLEETLNEERTDRKKTEEDAVHLLISKKKSFDQQIKNLSRKYDSEIKLLQDMVEEKRERAANNVGDAQREMKDLLSQLTDCQHKILKVCCVPSVLDRS